MHLALLPFGEQSLRHFMYLERPEGMDLSDSVGLAAFNRAAPAVSEGEIVPRAQDFATVGHLYRSIEAGIKHLTDKYGPERLFVGPKRAQATAEYFRWPELIAVTDAASAQRAIDEILEQGEGPRGHWENAHFGQFVEILDEYSQLRQANPAFEPTRPVEPVNVRPAERDQSIALVTDPVTSQVMDLFNVAYEILLLMLQRYFSHTEETDAQLHGLADAATALMVRVIGPLGDLVTTLPAGPEYPGRTAGPSFELFYESDYVLPHLRAAWVLLIGRVRQAARFCEPGAPCDPALAGDLAGIRSSLLDIAGSLSGYLPADDPAVPRIPRSVDPAEVADLLARAHDLYRTGRAAPGRDDQSSSGLTDLLGSVYQLVLAYRTDGATVSRLVRSVLRPLAETLAPGAPATPDAGPPTALPTSGGTPPGLWDVVVSATELRARLDAAAPPGLIEAVAALQDLGCQQLLLPPERASRIASLGQAQRSLRPGVTVARNGPYLVTNAPVVYDALGEPMSVPPQLALCRCGGSAIKPFCDGTHAENGFSGDKDPHRVPDHRDTYRGQQVTVFDNQGICQHSGLCTDRLPTVFRTGAEPFVTPSGGRMDEIVRAVRDCPSGALSVGFDGRESRDLTDWHGQRRPAVEVTQDGPYRITGGLPLAAESVPGEASTDVPRAKGSSREHYALCRCGQSQNKPFCSGMHWYVGFQDPVRPDHAEPTVFEWAGGLSPLTRMTRLLYAKHVPADDLLAPEFATMPPDFPDREAALLAEAFGAPLPSANGVPLSHTVADLTGRGFTEEQRARWVALALRAADEAQLPGDPQFRAALTSYLDWSSRTSMAQPQHGDSKDGAAPLPRWTWGPAGPPARPPAPQAEQAEQAEVSLPGPGEPVSFATHIKPMFREKDRSSMSFAFDLWSHGDVQSHAAEILARLRDASMPCDGAWPAERIDVFARWTGSGTLP